MTASLDDDIIRASPLQQKKKQLRNNTPRSNLVIAAVTASALLLASATAAVLLLASIQMMPAPNRPAWATGTDIHIINGKIAFSSNRTGGWEIYTVNADGTGSTNVSNMPEADDTPLPHLVF